MPYIYTLAYENSTTGMPLMRPLMFENEQDLSLINEANTYLWGDAFLVTPVTEAGAKQVDVNFPSGVWFDYFTGKQVNGGQKLAYPVQIETLPVFVRAGSFVPTTTNIKNTKAYDPNHLVLDYYYHESVEQSEGQLYQDDGISPNSLAQKAYQRWQFEADNKGNELTIGLVQSGNGFTGLDANQETELVIHHWPHNLNAVLYDGKPLPTFKSERAYTLASAGAFWDEQSKTIKVKLTLNSKQHQLVLQK